MRVGSDIEMLSGHPLFEGFTPAQLTMVASLFQRKSFAARKTILSMGHSDGDVYILLQGTVKVSIERPNERDVMVAICGAGEILGEMNALDGLGHSATVVTLEPCSCLRIERSAFVDILRTVPLLSFNLTLNTTRRLRLATAHIRIRANRNVGARVADQLLAFAHLYGETSDAGEVVIPFRLTQSDLAELIGATRASVNSAIVAFKKSGAISVDSSQRIIIHQSEALLKRCR